MSAQNTFTTGANIPNIPKKSKVKIVSNVRMSAQIIFAFLCKYSDRGDGQDGSEEDFMESNICPPLTPRTPQPKPERQKQKRIETTKTKAKTIFSASDTSNTASQTQKKKAEPQKKHKRDKPELLVHL